MAISNPTHADVRYRVAWRSVSVSALDEIKETTKESVKEKVKETEEREGLPAAVLEVYKSEETLASCCCTKLKFAVSTLNPGKFCFEVMLLLQQQQHLEETEEDAAEEKETQRGDTEETDDDIQT